MKTLPIIFLLASLINFSFAQTVWIGSDGGNFNTGGNWNNGVPSNANPGTMNNASNIQVAQRSLEDVTLTASGSSLTRLGQINTDNTSLTFTDTSLISGNNQGLIMNRSNILLNGSSLLSANNTFAVRSGTTITADGTSRLITTGGQGVFNIQEASTINLLGTSVLNTNRDLNMRDANTLLNINGGSATFSNGGVNRVAGGARVELIDGTLGGNNLTFKLVGSTLWAR